MGWKTIRGRRYFYEWVTVAGRRVSKCRGSGPEARVAAERASQRQTELAIIRRWQIEDSKIDQVAQMTARSTWKEAQLLLKDNGYRHVKGKWRKMQPRTTSAEIPAELCSVNALSDNEHFKLENDVRQRTLEGLKRSGLGSDLDEDRLKEIHTDVLAKVEAMREEFRYDTCSAIEKMMIEQIITAWVQWYVASWQLETAQINEDNLATSRYLEHRYLRAQHRLSKLIEQLAKIRCVPRVYLSGCKR